MVKISFDIEGKGGKGGRVDEEQCLSSSASDVDSQFQIHGYQTS